MAEFIETFEASSSVQTWTVPAGVSAVFVVAEGGAGGSRLGAAARGGRVECILTVTAGEVLDIRVGFAGNATGPDANIADWGGGQGYASSGGGGGYSSIRPAGGAHADSLVVAGGGGGRGSQPNYVAGGAGGGLTGGAGAADGTVNGGGGGTATAGGAAGTGGSGTRTAATAGDSSGRGNGGNGAFRIGTDRAGGGGGGGWFAGGGGDAETDSASGLRGGGGGGSSYTHPTRCLEVTHIQGHTAGNGVVAISWSLNTGTTSVGILAA